MEPARSTVVTDSRDGASISPRGRPAGAKAHSSSPPQAHNVLPRPRAREDDARATSPTTSASTAEALGYRHHRGWCARRGGGWPDRPVRMPHHRCRSREGWRVHNPAGEVASITTESGFWTRCSSSRGTSHAFGSPSGGRGVMRARRQCHFGAIRASRRENRVLWPSGRTTAGAVPAADVVAPRGLYGHIDDAWKARAVGAVPLDNCAAIPGGIVGGDSRRVVAARILAGTLRVGRGVDERKRRRRWP